MGWLQDLLKRFRWWLHRVRCPVCGSPDYHKVWYVDWPYTDEPGYYCELLI